jgi:hypothetical protein
MAQPLLWPPPKSQHEHLDTCEQFGDAPAEYTQPINSRVPDAILAAVAAATAEFVTVLGGVDLEKGPSKEDWARPGG